MMITSTLKCDLNMFNDELPVDLFPEPNRKNYRFRTSSACSVPTISIPKFGLSIMVAGRITGVGKTEPIIVNKKATINASYYAEKIPICFRTQNLRNCSKTERLRTISSKFSARFVGFTAKRFGQMWCGRETRPT